MTRARIRVWLGWVGVVVFGWSAPGLAHELGLSLTGKLYLAGFAAGLALVAASAGAGRLAARVERLESHLGQRSSI
jgi:hypothetical protein